MKKLLIFASVLLFSLPLWSQHSQGSFLIEGGLNFFQSTSETIDGSITESGPKESGFTFSPSLGYFITDNLAAGIGFSYSSSTTDNIKDELSDGLQSFPYTEEITSSTIAIGPFVRYYLMPFERSGLFLEASFAYGFGDGSDELSFENPVPISQTETISRYETTQEFTVFSTGLTPGLIFYISPSIALQATFGFIGYSSFSQENFDSLLDETTEEEMSEFDISFNASSLSFGLSFAF
jgi:outer membrane protein